LVQLQAASRADLFVVAAEGEAVVPYSAPGRQPMLAI
jgi:hypothetical protein